MSIKLKDTISDLINNSDKLDGKHASDFALSSHGIHWEGFTKRANTSATWGTLVADNGYTPLFWMDSTSGGGVAFSDSGNQVSMQIDGHFYQNEGRYLVLDTSNFSTYAAPKSHTHSNYLTSLPSHSHDYLPLVGGTLTGNLALESDGSYRKISIGKSSEYYAVFHNSTYNGDGREASIAWYNGSAVQGAIGVKTFPFFVNSSGVIYTLIHTGNIGSQSVNYATSATKLTGGEKPAWGVLKSSEYTHTWHYVDNSSAIALGTKAGGPDRQFSMQIDGYFYQNEGNYRVLDTSDSSSFAPVHSHPYLSTSGGTLSGTTGLTLTNSSIWIQGGSAAGGNSNRLTTTAGMPTDMQYNTSKRGTRIYSNGIAFCDPYNGNSNNDGGWIRHIETTGNKSILEIATGDDGESSEEIRFRKYNTSNNIAYDILVPMASGTLALTSQIPSLTNTYTGSSQTIAVTQYGTNALYNALVNGYANSAGSATSAGALTNLTRTSQAAWGTLTSANGYKDLGTWNESDGSGGSWSIQSKGGQISMQIDGEYYANEGKNKVLHTGNTYVSGGTGVINGSTITNVSYSSSTGYIANGNVGNLNEPSTWSSDGSRLVYDNYSGSASNKPVSHDNANSLITLFKTKHGTSGQYTSQLAFPDNARIYHRISQAGTWTGWNTIAFTSDIPSSLPANGGNADTVDGYHASSLWRSDGGTWNPSANIALNATANNQEWSFDITRNGKTGCYWHVWDSSLGSMLGVNADNGLVTAYYTFNCAALQIGGQTITFVT